MAASLLGLKRPGPEAVGVGPFLGMTEYGAGAVDEQGSEIHVSALVDVSAAADGSGRELLWDEPEVAGEPSS